MIYRLINTRRSPASRRTIAALTLLFIPLIAVVSVLLGLFWHTVSGVKEVYSDLKALFMEAIPEAATDLVRVIRDGGPA